MIHVFFNIDDGYKEQCKTVMRSILANTKEAVSFHIVGVENIDFEGAQCYPKPNTNRIIYRSQVSYISDSAVYRLFAPFIFKDLDKIIYLDSDLIVLDDISKLWDYDVKYIAGVQDPMYIAHAQRNQLKHIYINSGVMVMNLKNLRALNYLERIENTQNGFYNLSLLDQDIINIAFGDVIQHLPVEWNVFSKIYPQSTNDMIEARENPSLIHWCGRYKPWLVSTWAEDKWRKYAND